MNSKLIYLLGGVLLATTALVKASSENVWVTFPSKEEELAALRSRNQAMIQYIHNAIAVPYDTLPFFPVSPVAP